MDQYAIESNKSNGDAITWDAIQKYLKTGSALYNSGGLDMLGGTYVGFTVDASPKLDSATFDKLSDVAPAEFWSPYY